MRDTGVMRALRRYLDNAKPQPRKMSKVAALKDSPIAKQTRCDNSSFTTPAINLNDVRLGIVMS